MLEVCVNNEETIPIPQNTIHLVSANLFFLHPVYTSELLV